MSAQGSSPDETTAFWKHPVVIAAIITVVGTIITTSIVVSCRDSGSPTPTPVVPPPTLSELAGSISSPQPGERVPDTFTARGTLNKAPSSFGRHVWVAVRTTGGLIPKAEVADSDDGRWTALVYEPGCGLAKELDFSFALISVGNDTNAGIRMRRQRMQFIPVPLPGHIVLDEIQDLGLTRKSDSCTS